MLKAFSQNISQGRKKKSIREEYGAFEGRVALGTPSTTLEKEACPSLQRSVLLLKQAQLQLRSEENCSFIFSLLLLGGVDGCFGQKSLKGGFVTQDD